MGLIGTRCATSEQHLFGEGNWEFLQRYG